MKLWRLLLLLAAAGVTWILLRTGGTEPRRIGDDSERSDIRDVPTKLVEPVQAPAVLERAPTAAEDRVDPERALRGTVVDTEGAPIAGAELTAWLQVDRLIPGLSETDSKVEREAGSTTSDAAGRFHLRVEPSLVYDLQAQQAGFARTRLPNLYAGEELRVVMARTASISGRITDAVDGTPLAGVEVRARQGTLHVRGDEFFRGRSDANGEYQLTDLPPNFYELRFDHPDRARKYGPRFVLHEAEHARADLTLDRGACVRGVIRDGETDAPIAGAEVGLRVGGIVARADAEGRYLLTSVPVGYDDSVFIRAAGYGKYDFPLRDVPAAGLEQDFGLLRGRTARGRVVDADGNPVAGADVVAAAQARVNWFVQSDRRVARTDADGRFTLTDLRVDLRHTLLLHAPGHAVAVYDFPAEEWSLYELDLGDLALEPPCTLAGVVVDTNDAPQPDLWVSLTGEPFRRDALNPAAAPGEGYMDRGGLGFDRVSARTDARGRFAIAALPTGSYFLSAGRKGFARRAELEVDLLYAGEQAADLRLVLDAGLSISGIVVDRSGAPVPAATVDVAPSADPFIRLSDQICKPDGSFVLSGLDAGSYVLRADGGFNGRNYAPALVENVLAGGPEVRIVLADAVRVAGVVLDAAGRPFHDAHVQVWDESLALARLATNTDRHGGFELWVPADRPITLMACPMIIVQPDGTADTSRRVLVHDVAPGTVDLEIRLPDPP